MRDPMATLYPDTLFEAEFEFRKNSVIFFHMNINEINSAGVIYGCQKDRMTRCLMNPSSNSWDRCGHNVSIHATAAMSACRRVQTDKRGPVLNMCTNTYVTIKEFTMSCSVIRIRSSLTE